MYYLVLRPGTGESPSNVDGVLAAYRYLFAKEQCDATELTNIAFEEIKYPQQILSLFSTISGGRNIRCLKLHS
jgi:hypothetical protein